MSLVEGAPGTRYAFKQWNGAASGSAGRVDVLMDAPKDLAAEWTTQYLMTVDSEFGNATGAGWYDLSATAMISVSPLEVNQGGKNYRFARWGGDASSESPAVSVTMNSSKEVVAIWTEVAPMPGGPVVGGDFTLILLLLAVAVGALILVVVLRRRGRPQDAEDPPATLFPSSPISPAVGGNAAINVDLVACLRCRAKVMVGAERCAACRLELVVS